MKYEDLILNKEGKPLRILHCGKHTCIRVYRYVRTLLDKGYVVDVLTNQLSYGVTPEANRLIYWHDEKQLKQYIKETEGLYDIIHVANEPDTMTYWIREVIGDKSKTKILHDFHDIDSIRRQIIPIEERKAVNAADAIIYVSDPIRKITNDLHKVTVPTMTLYNYPTQSMYDMIEPEWDLSKRAGLVYEGGVNAIDDSPQSRQINEIFPYRNLFPLFQQLIAQGNEVNVYAGNGDAFNSGQHTGCVLHPPMMFDKLIQEITKYRYNLLVFNNEKGTEHQVNLTTPNKLWDALLAGLPSIGCYCAETMKYLHKHKLGWNFQHLRDVGNCSQLESSYEEIIENIKQKRKEIIFDRQIWRAENLYAEILGVDKKAIPNDIKKQSVFEYGKKETEKLL